MNLDFSNWKPFKLSDVFCLYNGVGITKEEIECNPGDFVAVQSGEDNNGCIGIKPIALIRDINILKNHV